jgi:hypothetical protein
MQTRGDRRQKTEEQKIEDRIERQEIEFRRRGTE